MSTLKENLENFLEHYENMTELSSSQDMSGDSFDHEFTLLKQISQRYRTDRVYSTAAGETDINIRKNRYRDILPFDHSRFQLSPVDNQEGSDYINANYLKGVDNDFSYLAAQGPLPHTVNDFWRMLWESNTEIIIMACNEFEQGRHKCERYWVDEGEENTFGDIVVTQISQKRVTKDFMIRTLKATKDKEEKIFNQFHYTAWPDHGVPTSVRPILEMIKLIREYQDGDEPSLVVHCSAGCGRTGTICVIDYVRNALQKEKIDHNFSLYDIILEMRKQRHAIVQTKNQYELVHRAVVHLFKTHLGISDADYGHNYENVQLRHDHFEQPRMPPKVPTGGGGGGLGAGLGAGQEKRDSHNYVNCNISKGKGVTMDQETVMPKLPTPTKPSRKSVDSPDGTIYANYDIGSDGSKPSQESSSSSKQHPTGKPRPSPEDRLKKNFKATLTAFQDIEVEVGGPGPASGVVSPTISQPPSHPVPQQRPKPTPGAKPPTTAKPNVAGKPSKPLKPKPADTGSRPSSGSSVGSDTPPPGVNSMVKTLASRQDSNPSSRMTAKETPPIGRTSDKKEALKIPSKPVRHLEKSKSDGGESPGVRGGPMRPGMKGSKGDRPSQPPPRPPPTLKPASQRPNGEERTSFKGGHAYEEVHITPPTDKSRGSPTQQHEATDAPDVRRPAATPDKPLRRQSTDDYSYSYAKPPTSIVEQMKKEPEAFENDLSKKNMAAMYASAYSEVASDQQSTAAAPKVGRKMGGSLKDEYSYVDSQFQPPDKPKRGESYSGGDNDAAYDMVNFTNSESGFDSFNDMDASYQSVGQTIGGEEESHIPAVPQRTAGSYQLVDDEEDEEEAYAPVIPERTVQSFQFVEEEEKEEKSASGKSRGLFDKVGKGFGEKRKHLMNKRFRDFPIDMSGLGGRKKSHRKSLGDVGGGFNALATALKPEGGPGGPSPSEPEGPKPNINEILEKKLNFQTSYTEGPEVYKGQDIGFPKRLQSPRGARSPPRAWGVRPGDARSAPVHL